MCDADAFALAIIDPCVDGADCSADADADASVEDCEDDADCFANSTAVALVNIDFASVFFGEANVCEDDGTICEAEADAITAVEECENESLCVANATAISLIGDEVGDGDDVSCSESSDLYRRHLRLC